MLSFLASAVVLSSLPVASVAQRSSGADLSRLMKLMGYEFEPAAKDWAGGTIVFRGARVNVGTNWNSEGQEAGVPDRLVGLTLRIEISVDEDIPLHEGHRILYGYIPTAGFCAVPHLGRTVTILQDIDFSDGFDESKVRNAIDKYWLQGAAYARLHGGTFTTAPQRDWSRARFPDALVLDRADRTSLARACASWGMKVAVPPLIPSRPDELDLEVEGTPVALKAGALGEVPFNGSCVLSALVSLPKGVDVRTWSAARDKRPDGVKVQPYYTDAAEAKEQIAMVDGIRLSDLRRVITMFAARVRQLRSEAQRPRTEL